MRSGPVEQQVAFAAQRGDGSDADPVEVHQTAVDQRAGAPGPPAAPVTRLQQADPQTSGDGIQRDAGPDDAAPDHQHVQISAG